MYMTAFVFQFWAQAKALISDMSWRGTRMHDVATYEMARQFDVMTSWRSMMITQDVVRRDMGYVHISTHTHIYKYVYTYRHIRMCMCIYI